MIELLILALIAVIGLIYTVSQEKKHEESLVERERNLKLLVRPDGKRIEAQSGELVMGSVVLAQNAVKQFFSQIQLFLGGNVSSYDSLLNRARREAVVRMLEQAQSLGADEVVNFRIETAQIKDGGVLEILAYGTAIKRG